MKRMKWIAMAGLVMTLCCKAACTEAAETCVWTALFNQAIAWLGTIGGAG